MSGGCVSSFCILIILVLICFVLGFLIGSYYEKYLQTQNKENFASLTKGEITGIVIISVTFLIILVAEIFAYFFGKYLKSFGF